MRDRIIAGCNSIPVKSLVNYIRKGIISIGDLENKLMPEKIELLVQSLSEYETNDFEEAKKNNTVSSWQAYILSYPNGEHVEEAKQALNILEDTFWGSIMGNLSKESLDIYSKSFPNGKHKSECETLLEDLPYLEVKSKDTIPAYEEFLRKYPGKHTEEINRRIEEIKDDDAWKICCDNGKTKYACGIYLEKHPFGKHAQEARDIIAYRDEKEIIIGNIKADPNYYSARELHEHVDKAKIKWIDLRDVYSNEKIKAIENWLSPEQLPDIPDDSRIPSGFTEVYFWGTKGSGKTCVIGSLIGSLCNIEKNFIPIHSKSDLYRMRLANLFSGNNNICILPDSTTTTNLPAMTFKICDEKKGEHKIMLIDMAGEAFKSIYKQRHGLTMDDDEKTAVNKIEKYLAGEQRNPTVHFFVIEYGGADTIVDKDNNITQTNILESVSEYFQEIGIFRKSTVGVYVVVTKCDKIDCPRGDRAKLANKYLSEGMVSNFVENLKKEYAKKANVKGFKKISFSIGDVFAQNLCVLDAQDTKKIIDELLAKTPIDNGLLGWLRYH